MKHIEKSIKEELRTRGIEVGLEEITVTKNNVPCTGIRIINLRNPEITPIVYFSEEETVTEIANRITEAMVQPAPTINLELLKDPEYLANHLYLAVSKREGEDESVVRIPYLNLDLIMRIVLNEDPISNERMSAKVTYPMLETIGIPVEDAFALAKANSEKTAQIRKLTEILREMGMPVSDEGCDMYVAACNHGYDGAAVLGMPEVFSNLCMDQDLDEVIILPSSTEEVIVLPKAEHFRQDELVRLVAEINHSVVDPIIQLDPAVYVYRKVDNSITVVKELTKEVLA